MAVLYTTYARGSEPSIHHLIGFLTIYLTEGSRHRLFLSWLVSFFRQPAENFESSASFTLDIEHNGHS